MATWDVQNSWISSQDMTIFNPDPKFSEQFGAQQGGGEMAPSSWLYLSHRIHVWYIYLHLGDSYGK